MQFMQRMDSRMSALEAVMGRLSLGALGDPAPLPEQVSSVALAALLAHPGLPPEYRTLLVPLQLCYERLAPTLTTEDEQKFQDAYTQGRIAAECPPKPAQPPQNRGRSTTSQPLLQ